MPYGTAAATPILIPLRRFAAEVGRSRQFIYSEMKVGRLKTVLHGGRRFVHHLERDRYIAAIMTAACGSANPGVKRARDTRAEVAR